LLVRVRFQALRERLERRHVRYGVHRPRCTGKGRESLSPEHRESNARALELVPGILLLQLCAGNGEFG
jgi:hypothetical protein